jgi:nicotinate-nucleotide pyrophosphorylase
MSERWLYAGARHHGAVERQITEMVKRIHERTLHRVKIEVHSTETYALRDKIAAIKRIIQGANMPGQAILEISMILDSPIESKGLGDE